MEQSVTTAPKRALTIKDQLQGQQFREAVSKALPKHLTPDRFIRVALTAMTRTPKLAQCEQASFFQCLLTLSQLGLEPDGRRAHLIPFDNRKRGVTECQLIIDYKGLAELAMRSGSLAQPPTAQVVCEQDEFEWDRGRIIKHKVNWRQPRGDVYAVYSIAVTKDGGEIADVMTVEEVNRVRDASPNYRFARDKDETVWGKHWEEMAKKTVFRRLSKWLPLSPEFRDALEHDADEIEERRAEAAKPVTVMDVQSPFTEVDSLPERTEEATVKPAEVVREQPATDPAPRGEPEPLIQAQLAALVTESAGSNFDSWKKFALEMGHMPPEQADNINSFDEVPDAMAKRFVSAKAGMIRALKGAAK